MPEDTLKNDIKIVSVKVENLTKQVDKHDNQIKDLCKADTDRQIEFGELKNTVNNISEGTSRVEEMVANIEKNVTNIVYVKPLATYQKIIWVILSLVLTFLVTILLKTLFPILH